MDDRIGHVEVEILGKKPVNVKSKEVEYQAEMHSETFRDTFECRCRDNSRQLATLGNEEAEAEVKTLAKKPLDLETG